jgi:hypothetical protein
MGVLLGKQEGEEGVVLEYYLGKLVVRVDVN